VSFLYVIWLISYSYNIFWIMFSWILQTSGIKAEGSCRYDGDQLIRDEKCSRGTLTWEEDYWISKCESKSHIG